MRLAFTEGKWYVLTCVIALAILGIFQSWWIVVPLAAMIFILYFFRDPVRQPPSRPEAILSPADGTVVSVSKKDCKFVGADSWQVTIFMSPLNVHVNRSPISGQVVNSEHTPGRFLPAMNPQAPLINEKNTITIQGQHRVEVIQIAGIVARRVVSWVKPGLEVGQGDKIGMIKFSSCTQVTFPGSFTPMVEAGTRVAAGLTEIGERVSK